MLEAARELYAVPPVDFIASRNALSKQLKAAGQSSEAATVAKLRRPRLAEWALNRLARADPTLIADFAQAIATTQRAQSAAIAGDARTLRAATAELREALNTVAEAAVRGLSVEGGGGGESQRDDLTEILRELVATTDPSPLVAGVIGSAAIVSSGEFFPGAPDPSPRPARPTTTTSARHTPTAHATPPRSTPSASPTRATAAAVRAMARAERLRLTERVRAASKAVAGATVAAKQAEAALAVQRRELQAASDALRSAEADLAEFEASTRNEPD